MRALFIVKVLRIPWRHCASNPLCAEGVVTILSLNGSDAFPIAINNLDEELKWFINYTVESDVD